MDHLRPRSTPSDTRTRSDRGPGDQTTRRGGSGDASQRLWSNSVATSVRPPSSLFSSLSLHPSTPGPRPRPPPPSLVRVPAPTSNRVVPSHPLDSSRRRHVVADLLPGGVIPFFTRSSFLIFGSPGAVFGRILGRLMGKVGSLR